MSVDYIREFGDCASDAILDPRCKHFTTPETEGIIGYKFIGNCAVSYGDPICPESNKAKLAKAFTKFCEEQNKSIIYVVASKDFVQKSLNDSTHAYIEFGKMLFIDPQDDPRNKSGRYACALRNKIKHAEREGVSVKEYTGHDAKLEEAIEKASQGWLDRRKGLQVYISPVRVFDDRQGKRWFYATKDETIIGVVVLEEIKSKNGWHLNRLMTLENVPGGTPEILLITAIEALQKESCHYLAFGQAPSHDLDEIKGFGKITTFITKQIYKISKKVLKIEGRLDFWDKFFPQADPSYLLFSRPKIGVSEILAIMKGMNVGTK
jgi:lysylphosphatidylglycerol synthetase-like protein (DUF2156 family)